jgi:hypothetical protein
MPGKLITRRMHGMYSIWPEEYLGWLQPIVCQLLIQPEECCDEYDQKNAWDEYNQENV